VRLESASALSAFSKSSVQLVELKFVTVGFGAVGVATLDWLVQAAEPLAVTLKVLEISDCKGIEGQQMPSQLGKLVKLKVLKMNGNRLEGICSIVASVYTLASKFC
jgi:malic enzyme